ncbi:flavin reductase [Paucibacter aquatile]|uniref:Flavin reductase n=1 Tax=Kinneretia aquatilis TaxID=2070761 RepID=A0A2N8KV40_9BURK|nr:flavin reductase family protein [Paucibacter aquatile]PND37313.1 flavin reductase [Paucibacter aquatile]
MRHTVELRHASRLLNTGPTVLVSSRHGAQQDVMAAAWNMPLDFEPPKIAVVIDKNTFTRGLIEASGEFVIAVPCVAQAAMVTGVGHCSGRDVDKFERFGLRTQPGSQVAAPLIEGCLAWLECRRIPDPAQEQRYDLFLAEVVAAWAENWAFTDGHWVEPSDASRRCLHHLGGGRYFSSSGLIDTQADTQADS